MPWAALQDTVLTHQSCSLILGNVGRAPNATAALLCILSLAGSRVIECGGWQSSPAVRMACCEGDSCPMHDDDPGSAPLTQAHADSCCAASEQHQGERTPATLVFTPQLVALTGPVVEIVLTPTSLPDFWLSESPRRASSTPTHLRYSVLLV